VKSLLIAAVLSSDHSERYGLGRVDEPQLPGRDTPAGTPPQLEGGRVDVRVTAATSRRPHNDIKRWTVLPSYEGRKNGTIRHLSKRRLLIIGLLYAAIAGWVVVVKYRTTHIPPQPPDPVLDPINIRYFAYGGMLRVDVDKVYSLPIEMVGNDSAWVTIQKGPKGNMEVLMVRDGRGWKRGGATRGTDYARPQP